MGRPDIAKYLLARVDDLQEALARSNVFGALALRRWLMPKLNYSGTALLLNHGGGADPLRFLHDLETFKGGVWCGGAAWLFAELAGALDIPAVIYLYGYKDGLSHATTLIGKPVGSGWRFYNVDAYLGYIFKDRQTKSWIDMGDLWQRVATGQTKDIERRDTQIARLLVMPKRDDPAFYSWLFEGPVPKKPAGKSADRQNATWPGAVHTYDKLLLPTTGFRKLAEQRRGSQGLDDFMLSLMFVNPRLVPAKAAPASGAYKQLANRLKQNLARKGRS